VKSYRCSDTSGPEAAVPGCSEAGSLGYVFATEFPGESAGVRDEPERREKIERGDRSGGGGGGQEGGREGIERDAREQKRGRGRWQGRFRARRREIPGRPCPQVSRIAAAAL